MNNYQMFRKIQEQEKIYEEYDNFDREDLIDELVEEKRINENNLELINKQKEVLNKIRKNNERIIDYGFDYDGFNKEEDLKKLIDMLVDYAKQNDKLLGEIE